MILLVNDDGIDAPGLRALYRALREQCRQPVLAVAPHVERSGQSHAITLDRALTVTPRQENGFFGFAIDGTPADCVKLAITTLCQTRPLLVVSGINNGPNVGRSIFYSGTLGAALEAAVEGFPALAVSRRKGGEGFDDAAAYAAGWAKRLLGRRDFRAAVVNLNLPATPANQWLDPRLHAHGHSGFDESYRPVRDARDRVAWRLHGEWVAHPDGEHSDAGLLSAGHPVLTMLRPDLNAPDRALAKLLANAGERVPQPAETA